MVTNIYCDGSCSGNPGPGGYAAVIINDTVRFAAKGVLDTTNQRMELRAAILGLSLCTKGSEIHIISDSQYLVSTMTKGWKKKANLDLWIQLDKLVASHKSVTWSWIAGHSDNPGNERANQLAQMATALVQERSTLCYSENMPTA